MRKLLFSFLILTQFASYSMSENEIDSKKGIALYEPDWDFLKEKFINEPQAKYRAIYPKLTKAISIYLAFSIFYAIGSIILDLPDPTDVSYEDYYHEQDLNEILAVKSLLLVLISCFVSYFSFKLCSSLHDNYFNDLEKSAALEFIKNWEKNKKHVPDEFYEFFENYYDNYEKKPDSIMSDLEQIIKAVKSEIESHKKS